MGTMPERCVLPAKIRGVRTMVRHHVRMVQDRTRAINRIHGMPGRHNITIKGAVYATKNLAIWR